MKKLTIFLLVISLLLCVIACADDNNDTSSVASESNTSKTDESTAPSEQSEEASEEEYKPAVKNLDGKEIKFLVASSFYGGYESVEIYAEELREEAINDAVFNRNQIVQTLLNCSIKAEKSDSVWKDMRDLVGSGLQTYDVYMPMINDAVLLVGDNIMFDLKTLENLKLDKDHWDQRANEGLEINNKLYFSTGDISILDNECTMVMFFNKKLVERLNMENPYQLVDNNEWTLDKVYEMSRSYAENLEDSNVWDEKDNYGLHVAFNAPHSFYFGCGGTIIERTSDGKIAINMDSEQNQTILSKVFEISYKPDVVTNKTKGCPTYENIIKMFLNDQIIFTTFALTDLQYFRDSDDFDYGILPYPLYNSEQDGYRCLVSTSLTPAVCIPTTCEDPEDIALVLENMAFYSRDTVTRAYYDITIKGRDLGDDDSERMLDLIFSSRVYDLGYIYNFGGIGNLIQDMNNTNNSDFASRYQAIAGNVEQKLNEVLDYFN